MRFFVPKMPICVKLDKKGMWAKSSLRYVLSAEQVGCPHRCATVQGTLWQGGGVAAGGQGGAGFWPSGGGG